MDIKFSSASENSQQRAPAEKKKQGPLVLLLLILIGGFTYLYFFTGVIKPQEAQKAAEAPATVPQVVKMPLPPRSAADAPQKEQSAATGESPKSAVPAVVAVTVPAVKPVAAPPASAKPAAAPAKPAAAPAKPVAAPAKPAASPVKPAAAANKKPSAAAVVPKGEVKKPAVGGPWSIVVGDYVLEEALAADLGRVRKSGLEPVVKPGSRKKSVMNRLFVSEFNDRASAQVTLEKLKRHTSDAFVMEQGGKFAVYAGSYLKNEAADSEKERLKSAGFSTTLKRMELSIPSQTLAVGPFTSKKAADAARGKLQRAGLKVTLSQP